MNFQTVEANNGNLVDMFGTFMEIGGVQYTENQKAKAICKITDDNGVAHKVHLYQGKGQLPQPAQLQQRHSFSLSTFQGNYQGQPYTGYSGFWKNGAQVNQRPPQTSQQTAPSPPQQPPQAAKNPRNGRDVSIERQAAGRSACLAAAALKTETVRGVEIIKFAIAIQYFHETGKNYYEIPEPDESITEQPQQVNQEDDIPF